MSRGDTGTPVAVRATATGRRKRPNRFGGTEFPPGPARAGMSEESARSRVREAPRDATDREWEVFVRERAAEPIRHVGSVTAPTRDRARVAAARLFGRDASGLWLCAATDLVRYSRHALGARAGDGDPAAEYEPEPASTSEPDPEPASDPEP